MFLQVRWKSSSRKLRISRRFRGIHFVGGAQRIVALAGGVLGAEGTATMITRGSQFSEAVKNENDLPIIPIIEIVGREGTLWEREYFDRIIRDRRTSSIPAE